MGDSVSVVFTSKRDFTSIQTKKGSLKMAGTLHIPQHLKTSQRGNSYITPISNTE